MARRYLYYLLPIFWMVVIFLFSSRSDLPSNDTYIVEFAIKKTAHVLVYFALTISWFIALSTTDFRNPFTYSFIYAFIDEIHQLFVPNRTGLLRDVLIDMIGIALASLIFVKIKIWLINISVLPEKTLKN